MARWNIDGSETKQTKKKKTYGVITYAACDTAGEEAAGVSSRESIHAWWWLGSCWVKAVMCPDPDPDPASTHCKNLACNDRPVGYLPVVGPGKSLAVAMVADSDSSKGRWGEQHRDKTGGPQGSEETLEVNMVLLFLFSTLTEVTEGCKYTINWSHWKRRKTNFHSLVSFFMSLVHSYWVCPPNITGLSQDAYRFGIFCIWETSQCFRGFCFNLWWFVCLFVCQKDYRTDFHEIWWKMW